MVYQSGRPEHGFVLPQLVVRVNSPHQIVAGDKSDGDDDDENGSDHEDDNYGYGDSDDGDYCDGDSDDGDYCDGDDGGYCDGDDVMFAMMIMVMVTLVRSNPSLFASKAARCSEEAEDLSLRGSTSNLRSNS